RPGRGRGHCGRAGPNRRLSRRRRRGDRVSPVGRAVEGHSLMAALAQTPAQVDGLEVADMTLAQMLAEIDRLHRGTLQGMYTQVEVAWRSGLYFEPGWYALRTNHNSYEHRSWRFSDAETAAEDLLA